MSFISLFQKMFQKIKTQLQHCMSKCFEVTKKELKKLRARFRYWTWCFSKLEKRKKIVFSVGATAIFLLLVVIITIPSCSSSSGKVVKKGVVKSLQENRIAQFNRIEATLDLLKTKLDESGNPSVQEMASINAKLNNIQNSVASLTSGEGMDQIQHIVKSSNQDLSGKITDLQKLVKEVKKQVTPIRYLNPSILPFKTVSVDIWNGMPYATVMIDGHAKLVGKNETVNHWILSSLDYDSQKVIFKNYKDQYVKVYVQE